METVSMNDFERKGRNLWKREGQYYRLFGRGITPNGCWIIAPEMREVLDIVPETGKDLYGYDVLEFGGVTGTASADYEYIKF